MARAVLIPWSEQGARAMMQKQDTLRVIEIMTIDEGPEPELRRLLARIARRPGRWRSRMQRREERTVGWDGDKLPEAA